MAISVDLDLVPNFSRIQKIGFTYLLFLDQKLQYSDDKIIRCPLTSLIGVELDLQQKKKKKEEGLNYLSTGQKLLQLKWIGVLALSASLFFSYLDPTYRIHHLTLQKKKKRIRVLRSSLQIWPNCINPCHLDPWSWAHQNHICNLSIHCCLWAELVGLTQSCQKCNGFFFNPHKESRRKGTNANMQSMWCEVHHYILKFLLTRR